MSERYVPAAGRDWLTGTYDRTIALTMREPAWRPALVASVAAGVVDGGTVVEAGCGTGTLSIALAAVREDVTVIGVDGDPAVLALARAKPGAARVRWAEGLADALPLGDSTAGAAVCSLLLHHLGDAAKAAALAEIARVLALGGALWVADWGPPRGPAAALGSRALQVFDGREGFVPLLAGRLPELLAAAGLGGAERRAALRTVWGTLEVWRAERSG